MKLTDTLVGLDRPVAYYPALRRLCGSINAVILFDQLFHWTGSQQDPEGWIYKTRWNLEKETGLTREEQEVARKKLVRAGLLEEKLKGVPAKMHYRLRMDAIYQKWDRLDGSWEDYINCKRKEEAEKAATASAKRAEKDNTLQNQQNEGKPHTSMSDSPIPVCGTGLCQNGGMPYTTSLDYAGDYQESSSSKTPDTLTTTFTPSAPKPEPPKPSKPDTQHQSLASVVLAALELLPSALHSDARKILREGPGSDAAKVLALKDFAEKFAADPVKTSMGLLFLKIKDQAAKEAAITQLGNESAAQVAQFEEAAEETRRREDEESQQYNRLALLALSELPEDARAYIEADALSWLGDDADETVIQCARVAAVRRYLSRQEAA